MTIRIVHLLAMLGVLLSARTAMADEPRDFTRLRTANGVEFAVLGEKPDKPAPTLFVFANDVQTTLTNADYNKIGVILQRDGYLSVSLDAPCHGNDNAEKLENALTGWRQRIERGEDLIPSFTSRCTQVLDHLIAEGWTDPARVAAAGTSRGGFLALHFAADEPRVRAVAAFAPVTKLGALAEFDGIKDSAATAADALSLDHFADKLAGRPMWICIGNNDLRVGTDDAIAFNRRVVEASVAAKKPALVEIHVTASEGHTVHPTAHAEAAAFIAAGTVAAPAAVAAPVADAAPAVEQVGDRACLFLDDRFIAEQSGLTRTWHPGRPLPEPAIVGDAWDQWPHLFGSVVFDPQEKLYRMWYSSIREGMFYAESQDGRVWQKPKLGLHDFNGSKENNLVKSGVSLPNVILDPNEKDPAGRFKL
ncbi:MAG: prolyl oligopeptidase family serine peptidase, partial [Tepidisphaeraceae bacterium]